MRDLLIGVDVGTSALKAVLVSQEGQIISSCEHAYSLTHPAPGYVEQHAQDWWEALCIAVHTVTKSIDPARVCALGLSTQGGTLQPVNAHGEALCNAISWMDTRAVLQQNEFNTHIGNRQVHDITGWSMCGGLNALQILWLRQNKPDLFRATAKFLSVSGYLTLRLTGRATVDRSNAGVEQLLDVKTGLWSDPILELLGIDESRLADLVPAHENVGTFTVEASAALGLTTDVVVATGGHDQYCAALGAGAIQKSDRLIATGTAWAIVALMDKPTAHHASDASISRHVIPALWGALFSLDNGGSSLEWLRNALKPVNDGKLISLDQVNALAADSPAGADGLLFYPYFSGVEYPCGLSSAKAGFYGLKASHDVRHMARAVMEGVACQAVLMMEALGSAPDGALILTGGASKSALWTEMIADIAGRTLTLPSIPEAGCLGAAALAGTAAGVFASPIEGATHLCGNRRQIEPGQNKSLYREVLENYKKNASHMAPT